MERERERDGEGGREGGRDDSRRAKKFARSPVGAAIRRRREEGEKKERGKRKKCKSCLPLCLAVCLSVCLAASVRLCLCTPGTGQDKLRFGRSVGPSALAIRLFGDSHCAVSLMLSGSLRGTWAHSIEAIG